ncbi:hypothetical protein HanRHA438_Chr06g0273251 [Helianthus annuus]|nr:hypothetical protein HanRHA438_Chr06g0273251 [Helianthus annuus]
MQESGSQIVCEKITEVNILTEFQKKRIMSRLQTNEIKLVKNSVSMKTSVGALAF